MGELLLVLQGLQLKLSGFWRRGWDPLQICTTWCEKRLWRCKANSPRSTEVKVQKHRRLKLTIWLFTVSMYTNNFTMLSNTRAFTVHCSCTFQRYYWFQLPLSSSLVHRSYSSTPPQVGMIDKTYQPHTTYEVSCVHASSVFQELKSTVIDHEKFQAPIKIFAMVDLLGTLHFQSKYTHSQLIPIWGFSKWGTGMQCLSDNGYGQWIAI